MMHAARFRLLGIEGLLDIAVPVLAEGRLTLVDGAAKLHPCPGFRLRWGEGMVARYAACTPAEAPG
jgi:hypothetical protein